MVKAKDILYKVGIIISIICMVCYAIGAFIFSVLGIAGVWLVLVNEAIEGSDTTVVDPMYNNPFGDDMAAAIIAFFVGIVFFVCVAACIINLIVCKKAKSRDSKKLYIASIVLGIITGIYFGLVAGIFGLILLNMKDSKPVETTTTKDNVVEEKPVEATTTKDNVV